MSIKLEDGNLSAVPPARDFEDDVNELSFRAVTPVNVYVRSLNVDIDISPNGFAAVLPTKKKPLQEEVKSILKNVNAYMPSGTFTAIIGASGSGKTSVLNVLSHRVGGGRLKTMGDITYNGNSDLSSIRSSYVMQQDILLPTLTVRETLLYAAELRLPPPTTKLERRKVVEEVILELGLKECANTRIGNNTHQGCSGGEKRRTSLAVQMLANPSVLFLDEVTTGLDAATAFQLTNTLKSLAAKGRTIICTIHQPRSEIWDLFDNVLVLAKGSPLYSGPTARCLPYFKYLGHALPAYVNPAEFLIDLSAIDTRTKEAEDRTSSKVSCLTRAFLESLENHALLATDAKDTFDDRIEHVGKDSSQTHAPLGRQIRILTARTLKVTYRDPMGMAGTMLEAISMAIITGWIFLQLDGSLSGIRSREGALYNAAALQGYLILIFEIYRLTVDIQLFDREYGEGIISVSSFLISRRLARLFVEDVPVPLVFSIIYYFMVGFRPLASQFFVFFSVLLLSQYIAVNFATLCVAASRDFATASFIANMGFTLQSFGCGYFVQPNQIPIWVRWLKWAAFVFYSNGALAANEFVGHTSDPNGQFYDCPVPGGNSSDPVCNQYTGLYIMNSLGYPANWIVRPIVVLLGFTVAFFLGAGLLLRFWKVGIVISKVQEDRTDHSAGKENMTVRSLKDIRTVSIQLKDYSVDIQKRNVRTRSLPKLSIVKPLHTVFEPGLLNVVMGPSGSGKTSLLQCMACRQHDSLNTKYEIGGQMSFNGAIPSRTVIRSICSYVSQDDDALLPYLTVRENLYFSAGLRLPAHLSKHEKEGRAESVLLKMGLRDCANNRVGNNVTKGISGGEKRRVTIAIQILTDPRVLFLDEPTSGLDAFTASSIIEVLRGLAAEGRTLVLTIHQSRSDLFQHFHNVCLLARGGSLVYAGKGNLMLPHFASLGFTCPTTTNPADFALDLITVNLQTSTKEAVSEEKVRTLILGWSDSKAPMEKSVSHIATPAELGSLARSMTPFRIAFPLLLHRSSINFRRNPPSIIARTTQVLGYAICLTLFFAPLKSDYYSVQTRLGFIQEFAPLYFVGMLQNVAVYPDEKAVFYREHEDKAYSVEAFFLQYTIAEIPFEIVTSLIFAVLAVLAAGLHRTASLFFIVTFNAFCIVSCGESIGIIFNTFFNHTGFAVNIAFVILSVAQIMGGVMSLSIPAFLQAFNHLSPIKWMIGNLAPYTLRGVNFTCTGEQKLPDGQCPVATGEDALKLYHLNGNAGLNLLAVGICVVVYRALAFLVLKAKVTGWAWKERLGRLHIAKNGIVQRSDSRI